MDEDSGDYSDDKVDEYDAEQSIDELGTIAIDLTEENPVTINPKTTYDMCNNKDESFSEFKSDQNNSKIAFERSSEKSIIYHNNIADDDDEENGDLVAKLLDPFEQLEREFNWDEVAAIKPPSAFSSGQQGSGSVDSKVKISQFSKNSKNKIQPNRRMTTEINSYNQVYTNSKSMR